MQRILSSPCSTHNRYIQKIVTCPSFSFFIFLLCLVVIRCQSPLFPIVDTITQTHYCWIDYRLDLRLQTPFSRLYSSCFCSCVKCDFRDSRRLLILLKPRKLLERTDVDAYIYCLNELLSLSSHAFLLLEYLTI